MPPPFIAVTEKMVPPEGGTKQPKSNTNPKNQDSKFNRLWETTQHSQHPKRYVVVVGVIVVVDIAIVEVHIGVT